MELLQRCQQANEYHEQGFNCAQSVAAAFCDRTGLSLEDSLAVAGGFGGGLRCGEVCGALAGAVMVLGLCHRHTHPRTPAEKARISALTVAYTKRFRSRFHCVCCRELLAAPLLRSEENTPTACALGIEKHCAVLIVTAIELLEELLNQQEGK